MSTPVLIVAYSRHENVVRLIESLYAQGVERIYLAIDGAKGSNNNLQSGIEESAIALAAKLNLELRIWRRFENLGPAVSVITAIDWFFTNEEEGVILEDDLILSSDALQFFNSSLKHYSGASNVFMVSGSNYFDSLDAKRVPIATNYPVIWGWATWKNRWTHYRSSLNDFNNLRVPAAVNERWFWEIGARRCLNGIQDAWDIPLAAYQLSMGYLSVLPPRNLISNCGADVFAGNTFIDRWPLNVPVHQLNRYEFENQYSSSMVFDANLVSEINNLFRVKIYRIRWSGTLPSQFSKFLDLLRYPQPTRGKPLIERIDQVKIPN
jgi:hypothetical protein